MANRNLCRLLIAVLLAACWPVAVEAHGRSGRVLSPLAPNAEASAVAPAGRSTASPLVKRTDSGDSRPRTVALVAAAPVVALLSATASARHAASHAAPPAIRESRPSSPRPPPQA